MDEYSGKRVVNGLFAPRKGLRDIAGSRDENVQLCSRHGCSSRFNSMKSNQVRSTEKARPFRSPFTSSNGKEVVGSSSRASSSAMANARKSLKDSYRKTFSHVENDPSESNIHGESGVSVHMQLPTGYKPQLDSAMRDTGSSKVTLTEVGCSSGASSSKPRRMFGHRYSNQNSAVGSSAPSLSKASGTGTRGSGSGAGYGLRNLKYNSVSDVPQSSTTESRYSRRDIVKRRNSEGESSSSSKGKKVSGPSAKADAIRPTRGISISDSRSSKNFDFREDNRPVSVRTRRSVNVPRFRDPIRDSLQTDSSGFSQNSSQPESPNLSLHSSRQLFSDASSSDSSAYSFPGNDVEDFPAELGINRLMNRDALQRYNMDGVAQVLVALERIEQDEELTYEQLLVLESNLFLGGLNFYDQHRDMRLDIDNMSYEELLALGERMGSVSTALTEEELSKCLRKSIYHDMPSEIGELGSSGNEDEIKCTICQEEYVIGDEIGRLGCEHGYHVECVQHWLRLKNWCPICKAEASSSHSQPSTAPS